MSDFYEEIYEAAGSAGLLKLCLWTPTTGGAPQTEWVGFQPLERMLIDHADNIFEAAIFYPTSHFLNLAQSEIVVIDGVSYEVQGIDIVSRGGENCAFLTKR